MVLDNLYSYNPTAKISDSGDVGVTLAGLGELERLGVPVLVVHHSPKGGTGAVGAGSIPAHFRLLADLDKTGKLTVQGNDTGKTALRLVRQEGRTTDIVATTEVATVAAVTGSAGAPSRDAQVRACLNQAPPMTSDRKYGRYLAERLPRLVGSAETGRKLVAAQRTNGWRHSSEATARP